MLLEEQRPRLALVLLRLGLEHEQLPPVLPAQGPVGLVQQAWEMIFSWKPGNISLFGNPVQLT